ncbi:amino acid/amide ABC transporter ATP-binding protein 2, HAAT family [Arboricoccus pini]|uniref:Amino acid/amide ABC transporter ATP-binding protein 2, HAAT family n=1 Tax=Arboricoccus pini TaxID=1963835 RepID=A0A212RCS3_9PROT|nr:urea ABC transporter ATP-binding subunit UrtE [Arboricoccus pini]SNB69914.1 amino acid/amide ABC transporter ATP-binding protein 2, HAAT family [Arboricoccus pini]
MLRVEHINLHYGKSQALWGVSLAAAEGAITCVLGRNGVGKTSTLRAITGQHRPSGGRITFDGHDITTMAPAERARRGIAFVPQGREIFPLLTVKENLETGFGVLPRNRRRIDDEIFALFPVLGKMLNRRGGDLSGGQQQQLAIGRAMVTNPKLIVLDEPTEGIQPSIIKDIGNVLKYLRDQRGMAVLLVEQYLDFARELADRILVMDRGQIVLDGAPDKIDEAAIKAHLTV